MSRLTHIFRIRRQRGFTLVETLAAISLITIAIVAPMALTVQSLQAAYYARDQITASNLAQEGIEAIRSVRDGNILATAKGTATDLFQGIWPVCQTACYRCDHLYQSAYRSQSADNGLQRSMSR